MKKIFLSILAVAALASCAKTEPTFEQPGEISFSPVSKFNTKAAVTDHTIGGQRFYTFANTVETTSAKYFENILFSADSDNSYQNKQVYKANPAQFWPNVTPLKFAGYTQSGNINSAVATMDDQFTQMTISGYTQPHTFTTESSNNDFMWFFDDNNDEGYTKTNSYVEPVMKHALSWITIKVKVDNKLTVDRDNETEGVQSYWSNISVGNIKFESINTTGNVTLSETAATWINQNTEQTNTDLYDKGTAEGISVNSTTATVIEPSNVQNNVIVIPQTPATLSMTYTYTTPANETVTETISNISLNYDPDTDGTFKDTAWEAGTHYTYELTIGATEIKIAPSSAEWTNYGATDSDETGTPINGTI